MITAGGYTTETAVSAIEAKLADAVAFGRMLIANPDLPQLIRAGVPLNAFDRSNGLWRRRTRLLMFSSFGSTGERRKLADAVAFARMFIANPESRRAIFLRRSQGIVGSATTTISGNVVRAAKFSPTLASC